MLNNSQLIIEYITSNVMTSRSSQFVQLITNISNEIINKIQTFILSNNNITSSSSSQLSSSLNIQNNISSTNQANNNILKDVNIFNQIYTCFQNLLYPIGGIASESDFIFCIFNTNNPFDKTKFTPSIRVQLSAQYVYQLTYSGKESNYLFVMGIFYLARLVYATYIQNDTNIANINYYLLPETLTTIQQLSGIMYMLKSDIIIIAHSLYYMLIDMKFNVSPQGLLPNKWPIQTLSTIYTLIANIYTKLFYSLFIVIISIKLGNIPFIFDIFTNNLSFIIYQDKPILTNLCTTTCTQYNKLFAQIFTTPTIISGNVSFNKTNNIPINMPTTFTWNNIFTNLNVTYDSISITFNKSYIIEFTLDKFISFILLMNNIFIIRQDMIIVNQQYGYLIFNINERLYARPLSLNSIKCLPGIDSMICSQSYINNLNILYNVDKNLFNLYKLHGENYYPIQLFDTINSAYNIFSTQRENTCNYLVNNFNNKTINKMYQYMYIYLLIKHLNAGIAFTESITFVDTDINVDLITFSLAIGSPKQNSIIFIDNYSCNPYSPDLVYILNIIENECIKQFNNLKDKNQIDKYCKCLYRSGSDLSPYCFDPRCRNSLQNTSTIYKEYTCKYPTCSQSLDITNIFSSSTNLNNIESNITCGAVTSSNIIQSGKYKIYFNSSLLYWKIDPNSFIVTTNDKSLASTFEIEQINQIYYLKNITIYNSYLIYNNTLKSGMPIYISLLNNKMFIKHKTINSLIYVDDPYIVCKYKDVTNDDTITFIK